MPQLVNLVTQYGIGFVRRRVSATLGELHNFSGVVPAVAEESSNSGSPDLKDPGMAKEATLEGGGSAGDPIGQPLNKLEYRCFCVSSPHQPAFPFIRAGAQVFRQYGSCQFIDSPFQPCSRVHTPPCLTPRLFLFTPRSWAAVLPSHMAETALKEIRLLH